MVSFEYKEHVPEPQMGLFFYWQLSIPSCSPRQVHLQAGCGPSAAGSSPSSGGAARRGGTQEAAAGLSWELVQVAEPDAGPGSVVENNSEHT